jgi:hypothetical protein
MGRWLAIISDVGATLRRFPHPSGLTTPYLGWDDGTERPVWAELPAGGVHAHAAADVTYDPTASGLTATDVQAAIDEHIDDHPGGGGDHPDLSAHDALGLATDAELAAHAAMPHGGSAEVLMTGSGVTLEPVTTDAEDDWLYG